MARPSLKEVVAQRMLLEYLDDDFVFRNQEVLHHLVKTDLEILSRETLDAMECLLQLATHYRAEILKLQTREMRQNLASQSHLLGNSPVELPFPVRPAPYLP